MTHYVVHPIVCGLSATDQGIMTYQRHYGERIHIPIYVYYLEGGDKRVLVDSGLEEFMFDEEMAALLELRPVQFADGLARHGLKPSDIDVIIHTINWMMALPTAARILFTALLRMQVQRSLLKRLHQISWPRDFLPVVRESVAVEAQISVRLRHQGAPSLDRSKHPGRGARHACYPPYH